MAKPRNCGGFVIIDGSGREVLLFECFLLSIFEVGDEVRMRDGVAAAVLAVGVAGIIGAAELIAPSTKTATVMVCSIERVPTSEVVYYKISTSRGPLAAYKVIDLGVLGGLKIGQASTIEYTGNPENLFGEPEATIRSASIVSSPQLEDLGCPK